MGAAVSSAMFGEKEVCIVMAGLACGGKTTIVYKLKLGRVVATRPTVGNLPRSSCEVLLFELYYLIQEYKVQYVLGGWGWGGEFLR